MKNVFTQNMISLENEADSLLEIYENLPDDYFLELRSPVELSVQRLKAFARVYKTLSINGNEAEFVIN